MSAQNLDFNVNLLMHAEGEHQFAKENNASLPSENSALMTLYSELTVVHLVGERFYISAGAKVNNVIAENPYDTTQYLLGKLTADELSRVIISEASMNYDDDFLALTVGRSSVDFDWLKGSIDGAIAMIGDDATCSLRLFWMNRFEQLQYNYYAKLLSINDNDGIYGVIGTMKDAHSEITVYDYYMHNLRNIFGGHINTINDNMAYNIGYTSVTSSSQALYDYDESFVNFSAEMLFGNHFIELGGSLTGENGLLSMIQLGSFIFGQFYLGNQVERSNALNGFVRYIYAKDSWRFEALAGVTQYDDHYGSTQTNLKAQELDLYLSYKINKAFSLDVGVMGMHVEERDPIPNNQVLMMSNLVYVYETY
jgi:hypothetical protein